MTEFDDNRIAHVARAMTDIEPSADLEVRIRARLDAETTRTRPVWLLRAAVATAAMAVVVTGTWLRTSPAPVASPTSSVTSIDAPIPQSSIPQSPIPNPQSSIASIRPSVHRSIDPSIHPSDAERAWMARRIPALEPVDALTVEQIAFASIQPEPLTITPLSVTPLPMTPIDGDQNY